MCQYCDQDRIYGSGKCAACGLPGIAVEYINGVDVHKDFLCMTHIKMVDVLSKDEIKKNRTN